MVGFAQTPKFLGTLTLLKIAALFRAEGPWLPEFLEPQKFSLVKLFCPILLIKFYFFCTYLKFPQIISTLPQNPRKSGAPHQSCAHILLVSQIFLALSSSPQTHTITHPPIEVTKILSDSHISTHVGFAHILDNSTGFERSSRLLEFLGKFIVGFAHHKSF